MSGGEEGGEVIDSEAEGDSDEGDGSEDEPEGEQISEVAMLADSSHGSRARAWMRQAWPFSRRCWASA